jgi:hypothetical protein
MGNNTSEATAATQSPVVRLKKDRAEAYGLDPHVTYTVLREFTKPGYKAVWVELAGGEMAAPNNKVKRSELRP